MKINKTELLKLGTPKPPKPKPKKITKPNLVLEYLKEHGETPQKKLEAGAYSYGHFQELIRILKGRKLIKTRLCSCGETTLFSLT